MRQTKQKLTQKQFKHDVSRIFIEFFETFIRDDRKIYRTKVQLLIQKGGHLMIIAFGDLMSYSTQLWDSIVSNYSFYQPILNQSFTHYVHEVEKSIKIQSQRADFGDRKKEEYYVGFENIHGQELVNLKCSKLRQLIAFKGTVTRTAEVRPELKKGVFKCMGCLVPSKEVEQQFKYTEPKKCATPNCASNRWELIPRLSYFNDFQKIRVQDDPSETPEGGMPRSMEVILRNDICEAAQPGDSCTFTGMLCVIPQIASMLSPGQKAQVDSRSHELDRGNSIGIEGVTGLKQTGVRDLNYKLVFIANNVQVQNKQFKQQTDEEDDEFDIFNSKQLYNEENQIKRIMKTFPRSIQNKVALIMENPHKYQALAESLFPSIYGHIQIKKAILLQLFSGVHKLTATNKISIRGDINILIVGDPSTAKSMFLKNVESFVPRSVYTNGKTTSAAGLTATVTRDQNGDVGLEAGALMLADNGVCCIDEFDKMDLKDQVAIHEAMQQQTISIAKAGIYATLNARTSILAAANPLFGRYDKSKALKHNINLSAPIMSRFDLFFVVCDDPNELQDIQIGKFIIAMHREQEKALDKIYDPQDVRDYIRFARKLMPKLTEQSATILRKCYKQLRLKEKDNYSSYKITVRQLQSMIRISEALARLHLSVYVLPQHVQEAYRLISLCVVKLEKTNVNIDQEQEELNERFGQMRVGQKLFDGQNLVQKQMKQMKQKKAQKKTINLSYEIYTEFQKNIIDLFNEKAKMQNTEEPVAADDQPFGIIQSDIIDYLTATHIQNVSSMEQLNQTRKLIASVLKKLLQEERILIVLLDDPNVNNRVLAVHPNYVP